MSTEAQAQTGQVVAADWGGGTFPYRVGHKKLGMWLFIVSDAMTFSALLIGYSYVRAASAEWPTPYKFYPSIVFATVMTLCLLTSSFTMVKAVQASAANNLRSARRWIFATILGGGAFLVLHIIEWMHIIDEGLKPFKLPDEWAHRWPNAPALFGASFFSITGLHMFHVLTGVIYLGWIALRIRHTRHEDVEISGLYWHFVDLVWMFVFPLVYIISFDPTYGGAGASH